MFFHRSWSIGPCQTAGAPCRFAVVSPLQRKGRSTTSRSAQQNNFDQGDQMPKTKNPLLCKKITLKLARDSAREHVGPMQFSALLSGWIRSGSHFFQASLSGVFCTIQGSHSPLRNFLGLNDCSSATQCCKVCHLVTLIWFPSLYSRCNTGSRPSRSSILVISVKK